MKDTIMKWPSTNVQLIQIRLHLQMQWMHSVQTMQENVSTTGRHSYRWKQNDIWVFWAISDTIYTQNGIATCTVTTMQCTVDWQAKELGRNTLQTLALDPLKHHFYNSVHSTNLPFFYWLSPPIEYSTCLCYIGILSLDANVILNRILVDYSIM